MMIMNIELLNVACNFDAKDIQLPSRSPVCTSENTTNTSPATQMATPANFLSVYFVFRKKTGKKYDARNCPTIQNHDTCQRCVLIGLHHHTKKCMCNLSCSDSRN